MLSKLMSLLKRSVVEITTAVGDAPAEADCLDEQQFNQQLSAARERVAQAESIYQTMDATQQSVVQSLADLRAEQQSLEQQARELLSDGSTERVDPIVQTLSGLRHRCHDLEQQKSDIAIQLSRAGYQLHRAQSKLGELERERDMLATSQTLHQTTVALRDNLAAGTESLTNARQSVQRIRNRHQHEQDKFSAEAELQQAQDTELQYQQAGIVWDDDSPEAILSQLKKEAEHGKP